MEELDLSFRRGASRTSPTATHLRSPNRETGVHTPTNARSNAEDQTLLIAAGQGDGGAIAVLFDRYARLTYSVALRVLRDSAAAEDVLQDVFLQIWRRPEAFMPCVSMATWVAVQARRRALAKLRRTQLADSIGDVALSTGSTSLPPQEIAHHLEKARSVVERLPSAHRRAVELAFFDGLTHREIAESIGDPPTVVKSRIRSALLAFRKEFTA